ncbi:hypothetical protein ACQPZ8_37425 [Actinomadura nitritigenes]|uniref:hypothetical protein n=1 Tax=Actinomadura nitritigenes TaxID=134602 RepID=UPI003D8D8EF7
MPTYDNGATGEGGAVEDERPGRHNVAIRVIGHRINVAELDDIRPPALRAWASACWHLGECGLMPLPPAHVVRALRRRGWLP